MEPIRPIIVKAFAQQPSASGSLNQLLEDTATSFNKRLSAFEAEAHLEAWKKLERKVGRPRFLQALKAAVAACEFFPRLEQIASRVPNTKQVGRIDYNCRDCAGTGWKRVFDGKTRGGEDGIGHPIDEKTGAVLRCNCYRVEEVSI
jgi:hypothetical protein